MTLDAATAGDVPGAPDYFVTRQAVYAVVGLALMLLLASIDYSRFRELRIGLYATMLGLILLVLARGGRDARVAALDRAAVLPLPALGARQGAAGAGPVGLPASTACGGCGTAR